VKGRGDRHSLSHVIVPHGVVCELIRHVITTITATPFVRSITYKGIDRVEHK
jgi:hypothetical protein